MNPIQGEKGNKIRTSLLDFWATLAAFFLSGFERFPLAASVFLERLTFPLFTSFS